MDVVTWKGSTVIARIEPYWRKLVKASFERSLSFIARSAWATAIVLAWAGMAALMSFAYQVAIGPDGFLFAGQYNAGPVFQGAEWVVQRCLVSLALSLAAVMALRWLVTRTYPDLDNVPDDARLEALFAPFTPRQRALMLKLANRERVKAHRRRALPILDQ